MLRWSIFETVLKLYKVVDPGSKESFSRHEDLVGDIITWKKLKQPKSTL